MKYLLMCHFQPDAMANVPEVAMQQMMEAMMAYNQQLIGAGVLTAAGQLAMPHEAIRVSAEGGKSSEIRGPALKGETQIGGYYVIEVPAEPDALAWAAKCPVAQHGALEVRQVAFSPL